jgi:hypothetical protein
MREMKSTYRALVVKREEKRLLSGPTHGWQNNIKMAVKETGYENVQ